MLILDVEVFKDYFLLYFKEIGTDKEQSFELYPGHPVSLKDIKRIMETNTTVSFNGLSYDLPVIAAALSGYDNQKLKGFNDKIIKSNKPSYQICRNNNINIPSTWDHIDLIEVAPGKASLKLYAGRLHAPKMQDLPFDPSESITENLRPIVKRYCRNDLDNTELLYNALKPQIDLRISMTRQYGIDLRSKSDAQIAEAIIKSELSKKTGKEYGKQEFPEGQTFRYSDPKIIKFQTDELQELFEALLLHLFEMQGNGSIKMPDWLKETKINIGKAEYQIGIGGLHSCEKSQYVEAKDNILIDLDVSSYYPSIILQQQIAPKAMGKDFLNLYQSLVTRRLNAKKAGDKVTADTFKICLNGSFGKLGSRYSALYAPELLIQTTITGQLALLMLIERMEAHGIQIMSANTDGIVCLCPKKKEREMKKIAWDWMLDTSFNLERTDYRVLASRDVNNYVAVKPDGSLKRKGCFASGGLMKNPDRNIVYIAVAEFLANGTPIIETVKNCKDIRQFITVRHVQGGAVYKDEYIGKAVRFYSCKETILVENCLYYKRNGNKVPGSTGCKPLMELYDGMPEDLDHEPYIREAKELLKDVGYHA